MCSDVTAARGQMPGMLIQIPLLTFMPLPQATVEQLLFTGGSVADNDHFPPYSNWCLTDKR